MPVGARMPRWPDGEPPGAPDPSADGDGAKLCAIRALLGDTDTMTYDEFLERGAAARRAGVVPIVRLTVEDLTRRPPD
ncbi:MAG: hypothetical protein ABJH68_11775 [Ilumatobacter sp.]|uniref:hypothetical protein n=1 Tax=Ilumatobacter sp. TaxID=1967498 RepID=UPI00329A5FA2